MQFRELYDHVQSFSTPVDLSGIRVKIGQLLPGKRCVVLRSEINVDRLRGYYVAASNEDNMFLGFPGRAVIVIADDNNLCWSRYVELKELMHLFDDLIRSTNNGDELEELLAGMCENASTGTRTPQVQSEYEAMWKAVALFCPEELRVELQRDRDQQLISDMDIAERLKMPEKLVPWLFTPSYKANVQYLLDHC